MSRYDNLSQSLDDLAVLAMDRYLRQHGFRKADDTRWYNSAAEEEVHHRNGRWSDDIGSPEATRSLLNESPQATYDHYRHRLHLGFTPWAHLPDASSFYSYAGIMFQAANKCCPTVTDDGDDIRNGNPHLQRCLTLLESELGKFHGDTIHVFNRDFASRLPGVLPRQASIASLLGICLNYEGHIWDKAHHDVSTLLDQAFHAMDFDQGGGGFNLAVAIVGSIASVAALVVTDGAAAPFIAGSSAGLGILGKFVPATKKQAGDTASDLKGYTPDEIMDSIGRSLTAINNWVKAHETAVAHSLHETGVTMHDHGSEFDLSQPRLLDKVTVGQLLEDATAKELKIDAGDVRRMERDDLRPIADELEASRRIAVRATAEAIWIRHDGVGIGPSGPFATWSSLAERHDRILQGSAREIREASHHLEIASRIILSADEQSIVNLAQVNKELAADTRRLHHTHH